jgi:hypothetical protein
MGLTLSPTNWDQPTNVGLGFICNEFLEEGMPNLNNVRGNENLKRNETNPYPYPYLKDSDPNPIVTVSRSLELEVEASPGARCPRNMYSPP